MNPNVYALHEQSISPTMASTHCKVKLFQTFGEEVENKEKVL